MEDKLELELMMELGVLQVAELVDVSLGAELAEVSLEAKLVDVSLEANKWVE